MAEPTSGAPDIAGMTARLARIPQPFLGDVVVGAVLADVLVDLGHEPLADQWVASLSASRPPPDHRAWIGATALVAWLLAEPSVGRLVPTAAVLRLLSGDLRLLSAHVAPTEMVADDDRREELCRLLLRAAGVVPAGETEAHAADRLDTLDTVNRLRVIAQAREAEEHARRVRDALRQRRAQEAAARAMRE